MEENTTLLPGWILKNDTLSFEVYDTVLTIRVATLSEARLAVMEFQDILEDQAEATVAATNPEKTGMERKGYLAEITKEGQPTALQMVVDYPHEGAEPDLHWFGSTVWPGQALLEFYPIGSSEEELVPEGFTIEDRRIP